MSDPVKYLDINGLSLYHQLINALFAKDADVVKTVGGVSPTNGNVDALPAVTSSDNGKVLRVVSGAWTASSLPSASGVSF